MDLIRGNIVKTSSTGKMKIELKAKQGTILKRWINGSNINGMKMFRY